MNDPDSEISQQLERYSSRQIRADLDLNTGVRYRGI
jgi:molybdopterin-containing oxidoreductase family iron-sulfur binding subunit